jgi:ADP-ribose pyrophosphatase YjhB (NUDIX family)
MDKVKTYSDVVLHRPHTTATISKSKSKSLQPKGYYQFPSREIIQPTYQKQRKLFYGIIAYSLFDRTWLVVKNKYTGAFCQILQGEYRIADLLKLVMRLRWEEWEKILYLSNHAFYFDRMYYTLFPFPSTEDLVYAKERFLSNGYEFQKLTVSKEQLERNQERWKFPSGPRRPHEKPQDAALRNYKLCTQQEVRSTDLLFLGKEPLCERTLTINEDKEEHHYWMLVYKDQTPTLSPFAHKEKGQLSLDVQWCKESELKTLLSKSSLDVLNQSKTFLRKNV